ncbi:MAG: hypothetical protein ABEJ31_13655 [Haloarculaceae archaeon]
MASTDDSSRRTHLLGLAGAALVAGATEFALSVYPLDNNPTESALLACAVALLVLVEFVLEDASF